MLCSIRRLGNCTWLVSLNILFFSPIVVFSIENENAQIANELIIKFDELDSSIQFSERPFFEAHQFLKAFVEKINADHRVSLTLTEAGQLIRVHLDEFNLPDEIRNSLTSFIEFLDGVEHYSQNIDPSNACFIDLRFWNWRMVSSFLKESWFKMRSPLTAYGLHVPGTPLNVGQQDPPDGVIIGLVEIFAGALLCIIPTGVTRSIGGGLILHGVTLALGATMEVNNDEEPQEKIGDATSSRSADQIFSVECNIRAWRKTLLLSAI